MKLRMAWEEASTIPQAKQSGELIAGMPKRFPGSPLVPALGKRNGHIAVLGGVVIGLAWNDLMKPFVAK